MHQSVGLTDDQLAHLATIEQMGRLDDVTQGTLFGYRFQGNETQKARINALLGHQPGQPNKKPRATSKDDDIDLLGSCPRCGRRY